jgi:C-terminal processing protease CtpA/Prc
LQRLLNRHGKCQLIIKEIYNKPDNITRDMILLNWIYSLGDFEIADSLPVNPEKVKVWPDLNWISNSGLNSELEKLLLEVKNAKRAGVNHYVKLAKYVNNPEFKNENPYSNMKYPSLNYRILSLFRYWNIIQYYFPYKYLIGEDWNIVLEEFVPKFINVNSELEYKLTTLELLARVNDTHANIWMVDTVLDKFKGQNYSALRTTFVENKFVVVDYFDERLGGQTTLLKGDVISCINNEPIDKIIKKRLKYSPASNYLTKMRDISFNLLRTNDNMIEIEFIRKNKTYTRRVKTYSMDKLKIYEKLQSKDTCFRFINKEIAYLYLGTINSRYFNLLMKKIKDTKGLIIDLRCYPSEFVVFSLGSYLVKKDTAFVNFTKGSLKRPGLFTFRDKPNEIQKRNGYSYTGKIVILVNEKTQSQAEYTAMAMQAAAYDVKVIGSTTAGADGNVSEFFLPGGIRTMISGIGVYYPNGQETQRVGIVPDIEVKPTIEGIKQGRDEVLEKAIEIINND